MSSNNKTLLLFDVDGTLTVPRNRITPEFLEYLLLVKKSGLVDMGVVSGSDLKKLEEQIGPDILGLFNWVCSENGLVTYQNAAEIHSNSMVEHLGDGAYQILVNLFLRELSNLELPIKRGTFLELRTGMLNVCPIGRSCTQKERDDFEKLDNDLHIREKLVKVVMERAKAYGLHEQIQMSIGGQISIDVFPKGWNKTYCLNLLSHQYASIHFFGDRIFPGGNDYEIAKDSRVQAHHTTGPVDTQQQISKLLHTLTL